MTGYDDPGTFRGQLQRGRGSAWRRALAGSEAAAAVYECVTDDPRWDRQVDTRDGYLAGLISRLDLPLTPIEQHLNAFDGEDDGDIDLALQVLAALPLAGRQDAAAVLRRYAVGGKYWAAALEAIGSAGTIRLAGIWDGFADDIVASHDDGQLAGEVWAGEPWRTFARTQPRIRRLVADAAPARRPAGPRAAWQAQRERVRDAPTRDLLQDVARGGSSRRPALEELGRRGDAAVLDLAEDPKLRNAAGWIPGIPQALRHLGPAAVSRAREWLGRDSTLAGFGIGVLAQNGDDGDVPALLAALDSAVADGNWCWAETPARGLGRLKAGQAAGSLAAAWESTVHSAARDAFLEGLLGCSPRTAEPVAEEGLYDCEPSVQRRACTAASDSELVRTRLRQLATDPLTPDARDAANARLATLSASAGP